MNEVHAYGTKQIYLQLDNSLQFRLCGTKEVEEDFFIGEINEREKMSKLLNKYITALHFADKTLLVLSGSSSRVSICSFATAIGAPIGIAGVSITLVFIFRDGIFKTFLKENLNRTIVLLARSKLNGIEKIKSLSDADISHESLSIRIKNRERSNIERDRLIEMCRVISKTSRFIREQEASELLSQLGI